MQVKEAFIQLDDRRLWSKQYLTDNPDEKATIVFLHDALGSVAQWRDFPYLLCERTGHPVLVFDRFGHGLSDAEPNPPDETFLDREALVILPEVLHQLKIEDPILYGHSDGGTIALIYASQIKTTGLFLEAAHVFSESKTRKGVRETAKKQDELIPKLKKYHGNKALSLFEYWRDLWTGDLMKEWNIEYVLKRVDVPTMIIQGEEDQYGTNAQVYKIAEGISGECELLLLDQCGHSPHKEKTDVVVQYVSAYIKKVMFSTPNQSS